MAEYTEMRMKGGRIRKIRPGSWKVVEIVEPGWYKIVNIDEFLLKHEKN